MRNSAIIISAYLYYTCNERKSFYDILKNINDNSVLISSSFMKDFFVSMMVFTVMDYQFSINRDGSYLIPKTAISELMSEILNTRVWFDEYDNLRCDESNAIRNTVFSDEFWFEFMKRLIIKYPQLVDDIGKSLMNESVQMYFGLGKKEVSLKSILSESFINSLPDEYKDLIKTGEKVNDLLITQG